MAKSLSLRLYYQDTQSNGKTRTSSKTINYIKADASDEEVNLVKTAFVAVMSKTLAKAEKILIEELQ